eukprot:g1972.t1
MIILSACIYFWHIIACVYWSYAVEAVYKGSLYWALEVTTGIGDDIIPSNEVFAAFSAQKFIEVMEHLISSTYLPGEFITKAGELISNVCFIKLGTVDLLSPTNEM